MTSSDPADFADSTEAERQPPQLLGYLGIAAAAAVFGLLFGRTLYETFLICWTKEDYSHGLLLPFISGYLIWTSPKWSLRSAEKNVPFSILGALFLAGGLVLLLLGEASDILFFSWAGFFPALIGLLFLLFGRQLVLPFAGALLLNFMAKPLPDSLIPKLFFPLQVFSAKVSARTLEALQVPVYLRGNVIEIPGMQLMVEEACSGLRSLMALLTVAAIVLVSLEIHFIAKGVILLIAVAVAVLLNVVRVAATGVLAHFYDPKSATGFFHTFSGLVVFFIGLIILYSIGTWIERRAKRRAA